MPNIHTLTTALSPLAVVVMLLLPSGLDAQKKTTITDPYNPPLHQVTSVEMVRLMGFGWNLGNTMEACGDWITGREVMNFETAWGNPETTREIIAQVKASGFNSVRIPVAWSNLMGRNYKINPELMKRVQEIVDWVLAEGMIAVVNIHWDGGWWHKFPTDPKETMKRYTTIWNQITTHFRDYPATLILESLNEEGCFNDVWNRWGEPAPDKKSRAYSILNEINQTFVDLVRASGGMNAKRHLLIAGYCTDVDLTVDPEFKMPNDPENRCIVSVHYYTPFTFAGLEKDEEWGKMRATWGTDEDFAELDSNMRKLKERFVDQGIPVIVGEYTAAQKHKDPRSVRRYIWSVAERSHRLGMCPMLWDAGQHLNRRTLEFFDEELLAGFHRIMKGESGEPMGRPKSGRYLTR
jgi:endoglucanase